MKYYILRRLGLMIPTLLGIMLINFAVVQMAPGGPVERAIAAMNNNKNMGGNLLNSNVGDAGVQTANPVNTNLNNQNNYAGVDDRVVAQLKKFYGFDKPAWQRFLIMIKNYLLFNFGDSVSTGQPILQMILERMPVSLSLGLWSSLLIYSLSIPLGVKQAIKKDSRFDQISTIALVMLSSLPAFLLAIFLIIIFAGGRYFSWFPLAGLVSDNFASLAPLAKVADYVHHLILPITASVVGGFTSLTILTKNSFLEELAKPYVMLARAIGMKERKILYGVVFRNAMLLLLAGLPAMIVSMFFTSNLMIEIIFSLNGLGLMGYEAALTRDYSVVFATLYIFTLISLLLGLIGDICYGLIDPRINFERMEG